MDIYISASAIYSSSDGILGVFALGDSDDGRVRPEQIEFYVDVPAGTVVMPAANGCCPVAANGRSVGTFNCDVFTGTTFGT